MQIELHLLRPLWLLAFLPLIWILWRWTYYGTTNNAWQDLIDPHLMPHLLVGEPATGTRLVIFLIGCGGTLGIIALAGPVWERLPQPLYQVQAQRVIVLDLSPTMNATDVSPSRLAQARFKVLDLLNRTKEGQTAMLAYGEEPFIVSPMTADAATIAAQIPNLETSLLPTPGTRKPYLALALAEKLLQQVSSSNGDVLLVTDGVDYVAATQEQARQLRTQGYRLSILGIGTKQGAPAPLGDGGFLKDANGGIIISRLPTDELSKLATIGGGKYVTAEFGDQDIESLLIPMQTQKFQSSDTEKTTTDQWREEGPWLLLLLLPLAASAFRRGWLSPLLIGIILFTPHSSPAFEWQDLWLLPDQQGAKQFASGNPKEAAKQFQRQDWQAAAHYKAGDYAQALETLNKMPISEDMAYNKGNTLAQLGKFAEALDEYEKFLSKYPTDADAIANRDLMRRLLDQQQQQQQQNSSSEKKQQSDSKEQKQQSNSNQNDNNKDQSQQSQSSQGKQSKQQDKDSKSQAQSEQNAEQKAESPENKSDTKGKSSEQKPQPSKEPNATDLAQEKAEESKMEQAAAPKPKDSQKPEDLQKMVAEQKQTAEENLKEQEAQQSMSYMLNRVPDDPGGLLRQRFLLQHLRNRDELQ